MSAKKPTNPNKGEVPRCKHSYLAAAVSFINVATWKLPYNVTTTLYTKEDTEDIITGKYT